MNQLVKLTMADLERTFLGFDRLQKDLLNHNPDNGYPRFNLVKTFGDKYRIELAVPGWDIQDLNIILQDNKLTVEGTRKQEEAKGDFYIYKGLSGKCFKRVFTVTEYMKVSKAYMSKGLLIIDLEEVLPDSKKPITIEIEK